MKESLEQLQNTSTKKPGLYLMAAAYVLAGINHFLNPAMYLRIMPAFVPVPETANQVAGVAEAVFGLMLLFQRTRNLAAWGIITLLIAVFPANIKMAHDYTVQQRSYAWITWLRLPLQGILIWWAYVYTNHYQRRKQARVSS